MELLADVVPHRLVFDIYGIIPSKVYTSLSWREQQYYTRIVLNFVTANVSERDTHTHDVGFVGKD